MLLNGEAGQPVSVRLKADSGGQTGELRLTMTSGQFATYSPGDKQSCCIQAKAYIHRTGGNACRH